MVQNIKRSTLCHTEQTAVLHRSGECNKMAALGYVITRENKLCTPPTLYLMDCHWRRDIRLSHLYVSPHTQLRSIGDPRHALEVHKNSVGRRTRRKRRIWKTIWGKSSLCRFSPTCTPGWLWARYRRQYVVRSLSIAFNCSSPPPFG